MGDLLRILLLWALCAMLAVLAVLAVRKSFDGRPRVVSILRGVLAGTREAGVCAPFRKEVRGVLLRMMFLKPDRKKAVTYIGWLLDALRIYDVRDNDTVNGILRCSNIINGLPEDSMIMDVPAPAAAREEEPSCAQCGAVALPAITFDELVGKAKALEPGDEISFTTTDAGGWMFSIGRRRLFGEPFDSIVFSTEEDDVCHYTVWNEYQSPLYDDIRADIVRLSEDTGRFHIIEWPL